MPAMLADSIVASAPSPAMAEPVVPFVDDPRVHAPHELASLQAAATRLSALLGRAAPGVAQATYWLPVRTLLQQEAERLGIVDEAGFWGGVVPHAFVGTKLVSHPCWPGAQAPAGWRDVPGVQGHTLPGWSVFSREDAVAACADLLAGGPVRAKSPYARGGNGQAVMTDLEQARERFASPSMAGIEHGLVVERDLVESATYGVGMARVGAHVIAYHGTQRSVLDHRGERVYGGSRLTVFRGTLAQLCRALPPGEAREAVAVAMGYDHAVRSAYPVLASRCNYDVIAGHSRDGRRHCGVLEQSWRFGGASMAEVLAMERFAHDPSLAWLVAETVERYDHQPPPAGAVLLWPGDAHSPCKYARILDDGC